MGLILSSCVGPSLAQTQASDLQQCTCPLAAIHAARAAAPPAARAAVRHHAAASHALADAAGHQAAACHQAAAGHAAAAGQAADSHHAVAQAGAAQAGQHRQHAYAPKSCQHAQSSLPNVPQTTRHLPSQQGQRQKLIGLRNQVRRRQPALAALEVIPAKLQPALAANPNTLQLRRMSPQLQLHQQLR